MNCPKCGRPVISGKTACPYCGQTIPILSKCPSCGWKLSGTERACPNCSVDLAPFLMDSKTIEALAGRPKAPHETILVLIGIGATIIGFLIHPIILFVASITDMFVGALLWRGGSSRKGKIFVAVGILILVFIILILVLTFLMTPTP